jgi:ParB family chromosome partitioning protein
MRHDSHYVEELTRSNRTVGRTIPIDRIFPNPDQPRTEIGDLTELSDSIAQKGVLEPILVKPDRDAGRWMIIAGERRWRASNLAGLTEVPCIELDLSDREIAEIALIENLQRKDLTIWEVADGLAALAEKFDYTHEDIARKIGKSRTTVTESLTIAGLPEPIREKCRAADITAKSVLLEVARQFDRAAMESFIESISAGNLKRREVRKKARPVRPASSGQEEAAGESVRNSFRYVSAGGGFEVNVKFFDGKDFDDTDVLKALKEAFGDVKARRQAS